jgi:hypothetical protein
MLVRFRAATGIIKWTNEVWILQPCRTFHEYSCRL